MINPQVVINSIFYSTLNLLPWRRKWQPTPVLLPGKSHGWRSLLGDSPWGCKESDMTERLHSLHFYSTQLSASVQFSSVAQSCPTLCDPVNCSMPGLPVHHQLPEFTQTHCPSSWWCHPAISSSVIPFSLLPPIPPSIRVFSNGSTLRMRWPKYWSFSFSISPSNEHPGLISFRMELEDCLFYRDSSVEFQRPSGASCLLQMTRGMRVCLV